MKRISLDADNLISAYLSGKSIKALAAEYGFSRQVVYRVLRENNIQIRNRSAAMYNRMAHTSEDERKHLAHAANVAKRGKSNTPEMLHKRALAHARFIGKFEQEFIDALTSAGIPVIQQEPFLSYNFDIGCGNVSVEIHPQTASPLTPKFIKKLVECVHSGRNMIYVWIPRNAVPTEICYQNVIALVKSIRMNPPVNAQYWVIRSNGETYASGSFDFD